jgi:hypothetical protein
MAQRGVVATDDLAGVVSELQPESPVGAARNEEIVYSS